MHISREGGREKDGYEKNQLETCAEDSHLEGGGEERGEGGGRGSRGEELEEKKKEEEEEEEKKNLSELQRLR